MPESNYTKEPWIDPSKVVQSALPTRDQDIEVKEYDNYAKTGQPPKDKEATVAAETKAPEETVTLSSQVTAIARKEAKVRQQQQALKAKEEALAAKATKFERLEALEKKLAEKDYSGLDDLVNYDEYTNYRIQKLNGVDPNQEAIKKLENEITGIKKAHDDNISQQFDAAVKERRLAVNQLVESSAEFPGIKKLKQQEAVVQHILDTWEHDEIDLSVEQATKEVETELKERAKTWASIIEIDPAVDEKKQLPPLKNPVKTITNNMTTSEVRKPLKSYHDMSESERYAEARRRVLEKLQKQG